MLSHKEDQLAKTRSICFLLNSILSQILISQIPILQSINFSQNVFEMNHFTSVDVFLNVLLFYLSWLLWLLLSLLLLLLLLWVHGRNVIFLHTCAHLQYISWSYWNNFNTICFICLSMPIIIQSVNPWFFAVGFNIRLLNFVVAYTAERFFYHKTIYQMTSHLGVK